MIPSKTYERLAIAVAAFLVILGGIAYFANSNVQAIAPLGVLLLGGSSLVVSLLGIIHAALVRLAAEEARNAAKAEADSGIFSEDSGEARFVRKYNLQRFEKTFLPGGTALLAIGEWLLAVWYFQALKGERLPIAADRAVMFAVMLACSGALLYILGSYVAGIGFGERQRALRAVACAAAGTAAQAVLGAIALIALLAEVGPTIDISIAWFFFTMLVVRGGEHMLCLAFDLYRPRRAHDNINIQAQVHESRIYGLLAQPKNVLSSLADTIHYQFGVDITGDRLKALLWQGALPLLALQFVVLICLSSLVVVNPGEQVLIERLGKARAGEGAILGPGLHGKWPWPLEKAYRLSADQTRSVTIGAPIPETEEGTYLWDDTPAEEQTLYLTAGSPRLNLILQGEKDDKRLHSEMGSAASADIVSVTLIVHYRVLDSKSWLHAARKPEELLIKLAQREVTHYLARHKFEDLMGYERKLLGGSLNQAITASAQSQGLAIEITNVNLINLQPPVAAVPAYQKVMAARQESERIRLLAEVERTTLITETTREVNAIESDAESYRQNRILVDTATANTLASRYELYKKHPWLYREFSRLRTYEESFLESRKVIITSDAPKQVINIDMKEKGAANLLDLATP